MTIFEIKKKGTMTPDEEVRVFGWGSKKYRNRKRKALERFTMLCLERGEQPPQMIDGRWA